MRTPSLVIALALALGCGAPRSPSPSAHRVVGVEPVPCAPSAARHDPELDRLLEALGRVDDELDRIDDALVAAEHTAGLGVLAARALAAERSKLATRPPQVRSYPDDPYLLERAVARHAEAQRVVAELEAHLGPRHVELVRAKQRVADAAAAHARQAAVEVAFANAWAEELRAAPVAGGPAAVMRARVRALARLDAAAVEGGVVPSDAPAAVIVAALRIEELARAHAELVIEVGPKHPDRVALEHRLGEARSQLAHVLARPPTFAPTSTTAPALVGERAMLAKQAQVLRRQLVERLARGGVEPR